MFHDLKHQLEQYPDDVELKFKFEVLKTQVELNKINPIANKFLCKDGTRYEDDEDEVIEDDNDGSIEAEFFQNDGKLTSYWNATGKDNRIYTDVFPCLDNFRWSTKPFHQQDIQRA